MDLYGGSSSGDLCHTDNIEPAVSQPCAECRMVRFCGVCLALSVIVPGMSFSTLLMPLGLYTPFVDGLGHLNLSIMIPSGIGAVVTVICFAKMVDALLEKFYSYVFHTIVGIVVAATVMIIPFGSFTVSLSAAIVNVICLGLGVLCSLLLNRIDKDDLLA